MIKFKSVHPMDCPGCKRKIYRVLTPGHGSENCPACRMPVKSHRRKATMMNRLHHALVPAIFATAIFVILKLFAMFVE